MAAPSRILPSTPPPQPEANDAPRHDSYQFVWQDPRTKEVTIYTYKLFKEVKESDGTTRPEQISLTEKQWEWAVENAVKPALTRISAIAARAGITPPDHFEVRNEPEGEATLKLYLPHQDPQTDSLGTLENFCMEITRFKPKLVLPFRHRGYQQQLNEAVVDLKTRDALFDNTIRFAANYLNHYHPTSQNSVILFNETPSKPVVGTVTYAHPDWNLDFPPLPKGSDETIFIPLYVTENKHYILLYRLNGEWHYFDPTGDQPADSLKQAIENKIGHSIAVSAERLQDFSRDTINCGAYVLRKIEEILIANPIIDIDAEELKSSLEIINKPPIAHYRESLAQRLQGAVKDQQYVMQHREKDPRSPPVTLSAPPPQTLPAPKQPAQTPKAHLVFTDVTPAASLTELANSSKDDEEDEDRPKPLVLTFGKDNYYTEELKACSTFIDPTDTENVVNDIELIYSDAASNFNLIHPPLIFSVFDLRPIADLDKNKLKEQFYNALLFAKDNKFDTIILPEYPLPDGLSKTERAAANKKIAEAFKEVLLEHFSEERWIILFSGTSAAYDFDVWKTTLSP